MEERKNDIDPDDFLRCQLSVDEQDAGSKPSDKNDTAAQTQESSAAMQIVGDEEENVDNPFKIHYNDENGDCDNDYPSSVFSNEADDDDYDYYWDYDPRIGHFKISCNNNLDDDEAAAVKEDEEGGLNKKSALPMQPNSDMILDVVVSSAVSETLDKKVAFNVKAEEESASAHVKENNHFSDTLCQAQSQDTQRQNYIDVLCGNRNVTIEKQIKALINQNNALISQNQVMNKQIESIKKQFMILSTQVAESKSSHGEDTNQLEIEENIENKSLISNASEESANTEAENQSSDHSESLYFANALNESTHIHERCFDGDMSQQSIRRTGLFTPHYFGEEIHLEPDIYSAFIISGNWQPPFLFSLTVAISQFALIVLVLIDLLKRSNYIEEKTLRIPPKVEPQVVVTQFFSLIIAFITVDDMMVSLKALVIGYDPDIQIKNPGASYRKFLIANIARFFLGFWTIIICLVIIIQSDEVLQLFMDFVAVSFIAQLDNIAFMLARNGFLGETLSRKCEKVLATEMTVQRNAFIGLINVLFLLIFCPFLAVLGTVRVLQMNGSLLGQYACENLDVRFGDETLLFDDDVRFSFVGDGINKTLANSTRTLPEMDEIPTSLPYQFFSGHYVAEKNDWGTLELYDDRPVYWETKHYQPDDETARSGEMLKDSTSGKFYYCGSLNSWVFTIEALFDTPNVMAEQATKDCEWGWLMLSPPTEARILNDAPMEGWSIWTGNIVLSTPEFSISCSDCRRNEDCSLVHGQCNLTSRTCDCDDGWQGRRCQAEKPFCPGIKWVNEGESSREYYEFRPISHLHIPVPTYYDRPAYVHADNQQNGFVFIGYAGRRWFVSYFDRRSRVGNLPHAYWGNNLVRFAIRYSNPTTHNDPTGLTWNEIEGPRSTGVGGPFGASFPIKGRYECIQVDCRKNSDICGRNGVCVTRTEVVRQVEGSYEQCECANYTGGYFCEHHPDQAYSRNMYKEYIANPASYRQSNPNIEYLKFWVNATAKAGVGVVGREEED